MQFRRGISLATERLKIPMSKQCALLPIFSGLVVVLFSAFLQAQDINTNLGKDLLQSEIETYAITVFPDGTNLPLGRGTVVQGAALYKNGCSMCHGSRGIEGPAARLVGQDGWFSLTDPLRVLRIKQYPILLISVGGLWPHATTIFDYIRRAMPHHAPKSLSNNEAYALTAYLLYRNGLIDEQTTLDRQSILKVTMPAQARSTFPRGSDFVIE